MRRTVRGVLACVLLVLMPACAHQQPPVGPTTPLYIEQVPFFPQERYQCGPASLAAVLGYWGKPATPDEITRAIYVPKLKGTLSLDLWQYALKQGMDARMSRGSLEEAIEHLQRREPVIALLNLGTSWVPIWHYVVIVGWDPERQAFITYNGTTKDSRMAQAAFMKDWEKSAFWMLTMRQPI
jgi:ABC-type bacteriocin/lantibiotic exporter with double-glycine peptidase domain